MHHTAGLVPIRTSLLFRAAPAKMLIDINIRESMPKLHASICIFPGPELNGHNLLSFSYAGDQAYGLGGRVRKAHLWVKMDYRSSIGRHFGHLLNPRGVNLYVFQVLGNFSHDSANAPLKLHSDVS